MADPSPRSRTTLNRLARGVLVVVALDLLSIFVTGGVSVLGPIQGGGFALRILLAVALVGLDFLSLPRPARTAFHGYLVLLLLLAPLLHFRGYRLRGDGLWYYSYTHSLAFDRDIDLANNYQGLGIDHFKGSRTIPETGRARFTFPVGAPIAWIPFVALGHVGAWLRNLHGIVTAYHGFSDPYLHAVALGNLLIGWVGLLVLDRLLREWFSPAVSFAAVIATSGGSFLLWYLTYQPVYTHALTFLLISLFLVRWVKHQETVADYAAAGLLLGAIALVRWQNAIFGLLPGITLAQELARKRWRFAAASAALAGAGFAVAFLPQLITWKTLFDRFVIGVPLGSHYLRWSDPFIMETLFASRHGLFSWSPILIAATLGWLGFVWRHPRVGLPLSGMLLILTYINSAVADWWAGGSFGARRFDSALPILALGTATAIAWLNRMVRKRPEVVTAALLVLVVSANLLFMEQYRKERIPADGTISWEIAVRGMMEDVFDAVGYPFAFPANWIFASKYNRPKTQYDLLIGKYLFYRQNNLGGVIDLGVTDPPFIGNGWSGVKDWEGRLREVRYATGPSAGIFIPTDQPEPLRIIVECAAPPGTEPQNVEIRLNGHRLGVLQPAKELEPRTFSAGERWWKRINLLEFVPSDHALGEPYLAVDRLRFERMTSQ